ncbi:hypothetical protein HPP92_009476 [Vanilla planifolia]|uniref:HTH La-type RNA-binding domain-containing protein n=1 Tax=Vanilla planifolia TaxID=51239 RepID=A0A835RDY1_VANPL|nr:hypothetical protein HPP92_009476 [Vanilla planifolia]
MEPQVRVPSPPPPPASGAHQSAVDHFLEASSASPSIADMLMVDDESQGLVEKLQPPAAASTPIVEEVNGSSGGAVLSDDLRDKIVRQVEYYFSDENLPNDKFLLKQMRKDKEGYVPIAIISSFRKMKKLAKDSSLIEAALRTSTILVVSSDGKMVKRMHPLPISEPKDSKLRTILVENLPEDHSEENILRIFGAIGNIEEMTIHDPSSTSKKKDQAISSKVLALNDEKNWRSGMRVELLHKRLVKYGLVSKKLKDVSSHKNTEVEAPEMVVPKQEGVLEKEEEEHSNGRGRSRNKGTGGGYHHQPNTGKGEIS